MDRPHRNPAWAWDELILAMDAYLAHGPVDARDARIVELSEILNSLPIHTVRPDLERFRNANSVALKLSNFAALDPTYPGVGMTRGGHRDAEVWDRYRGSRSELAALASSIREQASAGTFARTPEPDEDEVSEGRLVFRAHRARERNRSVIARKKASALRTLGSLRCEVCGFDFAAMYGTLGDGYIEVHHLIPLSALGERTTRLADLALLCANCHAMAHRGSPWPTIETLRAIRQG